MSISRPLWSTERTAILRQMWTHGLTAAKCAQVLDTTRNAILGKVHREGMQMPGSEGRYPSCYWPRRFKKSGKHKPGYRYVRRPRIEELPETGISEHPVSLMERTKDQCCWPVGEGPAWQSCGDPRIEGRPYCPAHCRMAYTRKRLSPEERRQQQKISRRIKLEVLLRAA